MAAIFAKMVLGVRVNNLGELFISFVITNITKRQTVEAVHTNKTLSLLKQHNNYGQLFRSYI